MRKLLAVPLLIAAGLLVLLMVGALAVGAPSGFAGEPATSAKAVKDIPPGLLPIYMAAAATCPGLPWTVVAAIGKVESDHGQSASPGVTSGENVAGAGGPMQFLASTWAAYGVDGDGDGDIDRYSPSDAIFSAVKYLCANGAGSPSRLSSAIFAYNHVQWYVRRVLDLARAYAGPTAMADTTSLLTNPRLSMSANARGDVAAGIVDARLLAVLADLLTRHSLYIGGFKTGHPTMIVTDTGLGNRVSTHYYGRGVDIMAVDGTRVGRGSSGARAVVLELQALLAEETAEIGQPWTDLVGDGTFTNAVHQDHIHLGLSQPD